MLTPFFTSNTPIASIGDRYYMVLDLVPKDEFICEMPDYVLVPLCQQRIAKWQRLIEYFSTEPDTLEMATADSSALFFSEDSDDVEVIATTGDCQNLSLSRYDFPTYDQRVVITRRGEITGEGRANESGDGWLAHAPSLPELVAINAQVTPEPMAVICYLKGCYLGDDVKNDADRVAQEGDCEATLATELDTLVFDTLGDARWVSDNVNNAGLETQIEHLLAQLPGAQGLSEIIAHLNASDVFFCETPSLKDYLEWYRVECYNKAQEIVRIEADHIANIANDMDELEGYLARAFKLPERTFTQLEHDVRNGLTF